MTRFSPTVSDASPDTTVVLHIRSGTFAAGFNVTIRILEDNKTVHEDQSFKMPPAPEMRTIYTEWQSRLTEGSRRRQSRLAPVTAQVTHASDVDHLREWKAATRALQDYCKQWFADREFTLIKRDIIGNIRTSSERSIPIVIRCEESAERDILCRLPYQLWNLHTQLPNCEFALFNKPRRPGQDLGHQIKVLAIFGSEAGGLNLEQDAQALRQLENNGAQITKVSEPSNGELHTLLSDYVWDILFFAGHSASTCEGGRIQIRKDESLSLEDLRPSLVYTLKKGLKLAIFNSCDGLGIADFLSQLGVPNIIVMKEPVPDDIAGLFLTEFLKRFTQGTQLCQSIRRARQRIALEQETFPAASLLPIAYLNPNEPELALPLVQSTLTNIPDGQTYLPPEQTSGESAAEFMLPEESYAQIEQTGMPSGAGGPVSFEQEPVALDPTTQQSSTQQSSIQQSSIQQSSTQQSSGSGINWRLMGLPIASAVVLWLLMAVGYARRCQLLPGAFSECSIAELRPFISEGDRTIETTNIELEGEYALLKEKGMESYAAGDYAEAVGLFEALRRTAKQNRNSPETRANALAALQDPESLIYASNAKARANVSAGVGSEIYEIAIAAPLNTNSGLDIARGVAQAQAELVANGLNLVVLITNDLNQPEKAREIAEQLVLRKDILAVVGHYTSPNTCEALKAYSGWLRSLVISTTKLRPLAT
ncbi:MAG: CHAT domain-containing protein, partial [Cyanobacteria bacterium J06598_1]